MPILKSTPKKSAGEWRPAFIETLRNTANVRYACQKAGIDRKTAYKHRDSAPEFAAQWEEALEDAIDTLEAVAQDRARKNSDTLLIFLLKAHRPDKYRENTRSLNINLTPEQIEQMDDAQLADIERKLAALLR